MNIEKNLSFIAKLIQQGEHSRAVDLFSNLSGQIETMDIKNQEKANLLFKLAVFMFEITDYHTCINFCKKVQKLDPNGLGKDASALLFEAFIKPNLEEFEKNYTFVTQKLLENSIIRDFIPFNQLNYYWVTGFYKNKYFCYEKKSGQIKHIVSLGDITSINEDDSFSDYLICGENNLFKILNCVKAINKHSRKTYILPEDLNLFFSLFQLEEFVDLAKQDIIIFNSPLALKRFFLNSGNYLPRNLISDDKGKIDGPGLIYEIHKERLSGKLRSENILLTIGIPSFSRGKNAYETVLNTLKTYYDEEIEVVVSNNGTVDDSKVYYEKISTIDDPRLTYYAHNENQGFLSNILTILELARGKFTLFISDEDFLRIDKLHKILSILNQYKENLALVYLGSDKDYDPNAKNILTLPGKDSLETYGLSANYISGLIYNMEVINGKRLPAVIKNNKKNIACHTYPHVFLELLVCQYGYVKREPEIFIIKGPQGKLYYGRGFDDYSRPDIEAMKKELNKTEEELRKILSRTSIKMPPYALLENRISQHRGWIELIRIMEVCKNNRLILRMLFIKICWKTLHLVWLACKVFNHPSANPELKTDKEILQFAAEECLKSLFDTYKKYKKLKPYISDDSLLIDSFYKEKLAML